MTKYKLGKTIWYTDNGNKTFFNCNTIWGGELTLSELNLIEMGATPIADKPELEITNPLTTLRAEVEGLKYKKEDFSHWHGIAFVDTEKLETVNTTIDRVLSIIDGKE